jgi:archaellum component FlaC
VAELRSMKTAVKKSQLDRLEEKDLLNRRERELQKYVAENRTLRSMAGITDETWGLDAEELQLTAHIDLQKLQALHRTDTRIIRKLESDRIDLMDELRRGTTDRTRDGVVYLGLDARKIAMVEEYVERLRNDDASLPISDASHMSADVLAQHLAQIETWKERYARVQVEKDELAAKVMTLMERDKGIAYEQILKQITDLKVQYNMAQLSQSTPGGISMQQQQVQPQMQMAMQMATPQMYIMPPMAMPSIIESPTTARSAAAARESPAATPARSHGVARLGGRGVNDDAHTQQTPIAPPPPPSPHNAATLRALISSCCAYSSCSQAHKLNFSFQSSSACALTRLGTHALLSRRSSQSTYRC